MTRLGELIEVQTTAAAINFEQGLEQPQLVASFSPTHSSVSVLRHLVQAVRPNATADQRAMNWFGTYGAGKSRLAVLVGRMLEAGVAGPEFDSFLTRLSEYGEQHLGENLKQWFLDKNDEDARPYLLVPIYGNEGTSISNTLVEALYDAIEARTEFGHTELLSESEFDVSLRRLEEILKQKPELADEYLPNLGLVESPYLRVGELRDGLTAHQAAAITVFAAWHKRVCFGAEFRPEDYGAASVIDLYREAARGLANRRFRGVAIIWDEFGNSLEDLLRNPNRVPIQEIMDLQRFVETVCAPAEGHVLFMGLTHVGIAEYASRASAGKDVRDRLETIEGRFTPLAIELKAAEAEGYHLLGNQVTRTTLGRELLAGAEVQAEKLVLECKRLPLFSRLVSELDFVAKACYPLHPVAAAGLLALSIEHAQATRTAFTFFADFAGRGELDRRQVNADALYCRELVRYPELLQYYEDRIRAGRAAGGLALFARNLAQSQSTDATVAQKEERAAILTCLTLATLLGPGFQCNDEFLSVALHDRGFGDPTATPLREALNWLADAGLVWKNEATGFWNLGGDATVNPEALIEEAEVRISATNAVQLLRQHREITEELFASLGEHDLDPSPKGIVRTYSVALANVTEANVAQVPISESAAVLLTLPQTPQEADAIKNACAARTAALVFVVLPLEGVAGLFEKVRRFIAVRLVLEQPQSEALKSQLLAKFEHARSSLTGYLNELYGRDGFLRGKAVVLQHGKEQPLAVNSWHALRQYIQRKVDEESPQEPMVRVAQNGRNRLQQRNLIDSRATQSIVERVLDFESNIAYKNDLLGFTDSSESGAIVDGILGANELFASRPGGSVDLKKVEELHGASKSIVDLIRGEVLRRRQAPYNMTGLVNKLVAPPYGIPPGAIPLFVAVALREDIARLLWSPNRAWHPAEFICKALASDQFAVRFADFAQKHLNILEVLEFGLRQRLHLETAAAGDKHSRGREAIKILKEHVLGFGDAVLSSPNLERGARSLIELFRAVGKTPHEVADFICTLVDPADTLSGAAPKYEDKAAARDRLNSVLDEFDRITDALVTDFVQDLRAAIPNREQEEARQAWLARLASSSPFGDSLATLITSRHIDADLANEVVSTALNKSLSDCTAGELGRLVGQVQALSAERESLTTKVANQSETDEGGQADFVSIAKHREWFVLAVQEAANRAIRSRVERGEVCKVLLELVRELEADGQTRDSG